VAGAGNLLTIVVGVPGQAEEAGGVRHADGVIAWREGGRAA